MQFSSHAVRASQNTRKAAKNAIQETGGAEAAQDAKGGGQRRRGNGAGNDTKKEASSLLFTYSGSRGNHSPNRSVRFMDDGSDDV